MHVSDFLTMLFCFAVIDEMLCACMHFDIPYLWLHLAWRSPLFVTYDQHKLDVPAYIPYTGNVGQAGKNRPITAHGLRKAKHYYLYPGLA